MSSRVVRPLGAYEQYSSSRHALGLYKNVITVCRYALPAAQQDASRLRLSVERAVAAVVCDKLPGLRVGIAGEATRTPVFVAVPSLRLRDHVEWSEELASEDNDDACTCSVCAACVAYDARLMRVLERETARPWPADIAAHPPWRVLIFDHVAATGWADVAFCVHHAVADGKSGLSFHELLLETLNEQAGGDGEAPVPDEPEDPVLTFKELPRLVPTQESLIPFTASWSFLFRTLWTELGPAWPAWLPWRQTASPLAPYTGKRVSLAPPLRGHLRVFHLPPADAAALLAGCRAHNVTLTAALQGLCLALFARRVPAGIARTFSCLTPVSLRPHTTADRRPAWLTPAVLARNLSNLVAGYSYTFAPDVVAAAAASRADEEDDDDTAMWAAAAVYGASLKAYVATLTRNNILGLMGWVSDWHAWWRKHEGGVRDGTWSVSNTGAVDGGDGDAGARYRITRNFYTYSSMGKNELISVNVGSVRGGPLSLVVAWHDGVVADAFGDAFTDDLRACLEAFYWTGRFSVPDRRAKWTGDA